MIYLILDVEWNYAGKKDYFRRWLGLWRKKKELGLAFDKIILPKTNIIDFACIELESEKIFSSLIMPNLWPNIKLQVQRITGYNRMFLLRYGRDFKSFWHEFESEIRKISPVDNDFCLNFISWTGNDAYTLYGEFLSRKMNCNLPIRFFDLERIFCRLISPELLSSAKNSLALIKAVNLVNEELTRANYPLLPFCCDENLFHTAKQDILATHFLLKFLYLYCNQGAGCQEASSQLAGSQMASCQGADSQLAGYQDKNHKQNEFTFSKLGPWLASVAKKNEVIEFSKIKSKYLKRLKKRNN